MKTRFKFTLLLVAACTALSVSANAAVININNMAPDNASVSGFTVSVGALVDNKYTYTLTQTGDLDGSGGNDTLTFDLIYSGYTGSTFSAGDVTLGTATAPKVINNVNWFDNEYSTGMTLSLEVANIVYTSSESTVAFDGFTAIDAISYSSTPAGNISYYVGLTGATTVTGDPNFTPSLTSNGTSPTLYFTAAGGPVRLRNLDFQFVTSAIPEPSSFALLLGGLGMLTLIRRRA